MPLNALEVVKRHFPQATRVVDAKKGLSLRVTAGDVRAGVAQNPDACALALRCKRDGYDGALIFLSVAYLVSGRTATRYMVPASITRELVSFDRAGDFRKGEYRLCGVRESQQLGAPGRRPGAKRDHGSTGKQAGRKRRIQRHQTEGVRVYRLKPPP